VSSRASLKHDSIRLTPWLQRKAELAGLAPDEAGFVPLVAKRATTTSAALISRNNGVPKALVLMMGGNHLPGDEGLRALARALGRRRDG
jgi:hypothetical protein